MTNILLYVLELNSTEGFFTTNIKTSSFNTSNLTPGLSYNLKIFAVGYGGWSLPKHVQFTMGNASILYRKRW